MTVNGVSYFIVYFPYYGALRKIYLNINIITCLVSNILVVFFLLSVPWFAIACITHHQWFVSYLPFFLIFSYDALLYILLHIVNYKVEWIFSHYTTATKDRNTKLNSHHLIIIKSYRFNITLIFINPIYSINKLALILQFL